MLQKQKRKVLEFNTFSDRKLQYLPYCYSDRELKGIIVIGHAILFKWRLGWISAYSPFRLVFISESLSPALRLGLGARQPRSEIDTKVAT